MWTVTFTYAWASRNVLKYTANTPSMAVRSACQAGKKANESFSSAPPVIKPLHMKISVRLFSAALCALMITSCAGAGGTAGRTLDAFFRTFGLVAKAEVPAHDSDEAVLKRGQQIEQRGTRGLPSAEPAKATVVQR